VTLADLLSPRRVVVPLPSATLEEGLRVLVDACVADGRVSDPARLEEAIRESWPEDTMSLGPHAWLPHFRTDAVPALVVALGIAERPITGSEREDAGRRMILLIVAPPRDTAAYLQTVAGFARALARPEVAEALLAARTPAEALAVPGIREARLEGQLLVRDVMSSRVVSLHPDDTIGEAARLLQQHGLETLPVVGEAGQVVGLLSHRELLKVLVPVYVQRVATGEAPGARGGGGPAPDPRSTPVRDVMARSVLCVPEDQPLADAAHLLATKDVERVPVVKDGVLRGFLTRADLVRKLLASR
jgi:CBS domain-containing protein/mannitol/fructose-specific phosphotransferase system IIA component (Ntr-type)